MNAARGRKSERVLRRPASPCARSRSRVEQDAVFVLLGANGAGKTSILRAISGLVPARGGAHRGRGQKPDRPAAASGGACGHLARAGRPAHLSHLTVEENLVVSFLARRAPVPLAEALRLDLSSCFRGLAERRRQAGGTLSGGEQQMLAIGRAMMNFPKLLMLDEPSLGLSPVLAELVFERLDRDPAAGDDHSAGRTECDLPRHGDQRGHSGEWPRRALRRPPRAGGFGFRPPRLSRNVAE